MLLLCLLAPLVAAAEADLARAIAERRDRVREFVEIRKAAEELGIKVYLFGGTAAAYAHYVKWDLLREGGDTRFDPKRFDYDFTSIYRSTQDADLVVDGSEEDAKKLEKLLKEKMAFLQGAKQDWEVRLLSKARGTREALVNNPDFQDQNTDSQSTGLIALTGPGEVRDLRPENLFLKDVAEGKVHYYFSPRHESTSRFKQGSNPPIFSVIRFLTKAFQFELEIGAEDRAAIKKIIDDFDPVRDRAKMSEWARGWLDERGNGAKMMKHAVSVEYAWKTLDELGLREKLMELSNPKAVGSLGWWMNKAPLVTKKLGRSGQTAEQLGIDTVAHETSDYVAYESITRDTTGRPNLFLSRPDFPGERAVHGEGLYTKKGTVGAAGTGLTIRFRVDPKARLGADFFLAGDGYVIFKNRAALTVIPESLDISVLDYFRMLADGKSLDWSDRGILMKLKRRLAIKAVTPSEEAELVKLVKARLRGDIGKSPVVSEWFTLPLSAEHPEILKLLLEHNDPKTDRWLAANAFGRPHWVKHPGLLAELIERGHAAQEVAEHVLSKPHWKNHPDAAFLLARQILGDRLTKPIPRPAPASPSEAAKVKEWAESAIKGVSHGHAPWQLEQIERWFMTPESRDNPSLLQYFIDMGSADGFIASKIFTLPHWSDRPDLLLRLLRGGRANRQIALDTLRQPSWQGHPEIVKELIDKADMAKREIAWAVLSQDHWQNHPELVDALVARGISRDEIALARKAVVALAVKTTPVAVPKPVDGLARVEKILEAASFTDSELDHLQAWFADPASAKHPKIVEALFRNQTVDHYIALYVLTQPHFADRGDWVMQLIYAGHVGSELDLLLRLPQWRKVPSLAAAHREQCRNHYRRL